MAKLYLLYESDPWHSYSSMTPTSLVGVATSETSLKKLLKKRVRESYKQEIEDAIEDGQFSSMRAFVNEVVEDFDNCGMQTQSAAEYLGVEFCTIEVETNTIL